MRIIKFFYIYQAAFSLNTHQNANNFLFFLKRLRKISEKRLRVVEIFDTLKKHKKIHALSAWSFRFYRSLWLCS